MTLGCPGSKKLKEPEAKLVTCPFCAYIVEIWSDEAQTVCQGCGKIIKGKEYGPSCIEWCSFGPACVGEKTFKAHMQNKAMSIKEKLLGEKVNSLNFKLLYDADWLVNLKDEVKTQDKKRLKALIDKIFLTQAGKALASREYLEQGL